MESVTIKFNDDRTLDSSHDGELTLHLAGPEERLSESRAAINQLLEMATGNENLVPEADESEETESSGPVYGGVAYAVQPDEELDASPSGEREDSVYGDALK